jgi:hypothetical protein
VLKCAADVLVRPGSRPVRDHLRAKRLGAPADTIVEIGQEIGPYAAMFAPLREQADLRDGKP